MKLLFYLSSVFFRYDIYITHHEYLEAGKIKQVPYAMHRGGCLELYYCNSGVSGPGGIQALSERPTGFLQCTVGMVI